jgi:hypothetical protein
LLRWDGKGFSEMEMVGEVAMEGVGGSWWKCQRVPLYNAASIVGEDV